MNDYFGRPYGSAPYGGGFQPQPQPQQPPQLRTNKIYVTSLEDALNRYADPNTVIVYRHQDEKFEYEIMTNAQGKKSYKTMQLEEYSAMQTERKEAVPTVSMDEFNRLKMRLDALENEIAKTRGGSAE